MKYKTMHKEVAHVFAFYFLATIMLKKINPDKEKMLTASNLSIDPKKYVELIDMILERLDRESERIIRNNFIKTNESNGGINFYSRSTYYRIAAIAYDKFLTVWKALEIHLNK